MFCRLAIILIFLAHPVSSTAPELGRSLLADGSDEFTAPTVSSTNVLRLSWMGLGMLLGSGITAVMTNSGPGLVSSPTNIAEVMAAGAIRLVGKKPRSDALQQFLNGAHPGTVVYNGMAASVGTGRLLRGEASSSSDSWSPTLRFDNQCAVEGQREAEKQLLERHIHRLTKAKSDTAMTKIHLPDTSYDHLNNLCRTWVAATTDATWHSAHQRDRHIAAEKFFDPDFESTMFSTMGQGSKGYSQYRGHAKLKKAVEDKLAQMPDLKIRVLHTLCSPAIHPEYGLVGFYTSMPDYSVGHQKKNATLDGISTKANSAAFSDPVAYFGIATAFVAPHPETGIWQYQAEIVTHNDAAINAELQEPDSASAAGKEAIKEGLIWDLGSAAMGHCGLTTKLGYYGIKV